MPDEQRAVTSYGAMLVERETGFAMYPGMQPFGSVQITIDGDQGILSHQVGNLQVFYGNRELGSYRLWLVASGGEKPVAVHVGEVKPDSHGMGEINWQFAAFNVGETGRKIEEFEQVVVTFNRSNEEFHQAERIILTGLITKVKGFLHGPKGHQKDKIDSQTYEHHGLPLWLTGKSPQTHPMPYHDQCLPPWLGSWPFGPTLIQHNWLSPLMPPWCVPQQSWWDGETGHQEVDYQRDYPAQMVGVKLNQEEGVQFLVHGVLGRFCHEDWPYQGQTGYRHWQPLPGNDYKP